MANIITINQELINNQGKKFTIIKVDDRAGTAILKADDGESKIYSFSTLKDKRRFTPVEVEEIKPLIDLDNPITEEEAEELGMITGDEALETAVPDLDSKKETKSGSKARITITFNGQAKTPTEWAEELGLSPKYIRAQLRKGKTPEQILGGR